MDKFPFTPPHEQIAKLIDLASKATPGCWEQGKPSADAYVYPLTGPENEFGVRPACATGAGDKAVENAAYIAAVSPGVLLPILKRVQEDQLDLYDANTYVIRSSKPDLLMVFFMRFGLRFQREKHGNGPEHWACQVGDAVLEIYPRA